MKKLLALSLLFAFSFASIAQTDSFDDYVTILKVQQKAEYPGGNAALSEFLKNNVHYPDSAYAAGIQGKVIVEFIIQKDGSVTDVHVVRSVEPSLDAEAVRVVSLTKNWIPAKNRPLEGEPYPVRCKFRLPVDFRLTDSAQK